MKQEAKHVWNVGQPSYALTARILLAPGSDRGAAFQAAVDDVRAALAAEGFGVLTEIDLQATLKKKLNEDVGRHLILGACNPALAFEALSVEPGISALLPCNVVVAEEAASIFVGAIDPTAMFSVVGRPDVAPLATAVKEKLVRALAQLRAK